MPRMKRMGPADVIDMLQSGLNEMESNGYEVAESAATIDDPPSWYGSESEVPKLLWVEGGRMKFQMPDGSFVIVKASRIRSIP